MFPWLVAMTIVLLPVAVYAQTSPTESSTLSGTESDKAWEVFSKSQVLKPVGIAFDSDDNMYVLHSANRIKIISPAGKIIGSWDTLSGFTKGAALAVDKDGNVFVIATGINKILKYDSKKTL